MSNPLSLIQITDLHILEKPGQTMAGLDTEHTFHQVLEIACAKHKDLDLILLTGDLVQDPHYSSYLRIAQKLSKYDISSICLPGNHDDFALMQQTLNTPPLSCNKLRLYEHWQIICLNSKKPDSQGGYLANNELEFLKAKLEQHPDLYTLIAVHHHPIPTQSEWMDTMIIENSNALFQLLAHYPQVKAIICGHIHQEMQAQVNNISIFGTPSTCFQFKPLSSSYALDELEPGYRYIKLFPDGRIIVQLFRISSSSVG